MLLLLLSNSVNAGQGYLEHAREAIKAHLGPQPVRAAFLPYAAVRFDFNEYEARVRRVFEELGHELVSVHHAGDPRRAVEEAGAIVVGGGNTFQLVREMHALGLMEAIRRRVLDGVPYIGWSAGSNVACPTLRTTNDMPIVEPASFDTLGVVPFQINPHYTNEQIPNHRGETRDERIEEFCAANPGVYVVGLREGSGLVLKNRKLSLLGEKNARVFIFGQEPRELSHDADFNFLLSRS